jgi:ribulose-phosphate 3-epimerase
MDICTEKIRKTRDMIEERGLDVDVQVDGGITIDNVHVVLEAGANVVVAGSAVFKEPINENVKSFLEIFG